MPEQQTRQYDPAKLAVIIMDRSRFDRSILSILLRAIEVNSIHVAQSSADVLTLGAMHDIGCVLVGVRVDEPTDYFVGTARAIRHSSDSALRALPIIGVIDAVGASSLASEGRDAGMDMLLVRPISPELLANRMETVVKRPRPLVEGGGYTGPCRRRRSIDGIFGPGRRRDDSAGPNRLLRDDAIGRALGALGVASGTLAPGQVRELPDFQKALAGAHRAASEIADSALMDCIDIYGGYVLRTLACGIIDQAVVRTSVSALMQLAVMPGHMEVERRTVADELVRVVSQRSEAALS